MAAQALEAAAKESSESAKESWSTAPKLNTAA